MSDLLQRFVDRTRSEEFQHYLGHARSPWTDADELGTAAALWRAGFLDVETSLEAAPARLGEAAALGESVGIGDSAILLAYAPRASPPEFVARGDTAGCERQSSV